MPPSVYFTIIVSLGGFIFGFDASVISGAISFITIEFGLSDWQSGFVVSSPTLGALIAMLCAGVVSDAFGRRNTLIVIAFMYVVSALFSALATGYWMLVIARFIGGMAFCSLIIAPMYIAEISSAKNRGKMVSVNQLNIVIGLAISYFSNYFFLNLSHSGADWVVQLGIDEYTWRYMLGMEVLPAFLWFVLLFTIPKSPRWLMLKGKVTEADNVIKLLFGPIEAKAQFEVMKQAVNDKQLHWVAQFKFLTSSPMRFPLLIGVIIAIAQQVTGINVIFFYAPTIFEQSGVGTNAAFAQAILIGLVNVVFTVVAMVTIDRWGRKPLLVLGLSGVIVSMSICTYGFNQANYRLNIATVDSIAQSDERVGHVLGPIANKTFTSDVAFKQTLLNALGEEKFAEHQSALLNGSINMDATLILVGIVGFVASFAISLGPVMWVMLAEIFPLQVRAIAISMIGAINGLTSFTVQFVFPWELKNFGAVVTFAVYAGLAVISLVLVLRLFPETKGRSLEQITAKLKTA